MTNYPVLIGVNGRAQHGKDTIVKILNGLYGYQRVAFADALKRVAYHSGAQIPTSQARGHWEIMEYVDRYGWEEAKKSTAVRQLLQGLGVAARDHLNPDVWVEAAFDHAPAGLIAVSDMRFPNEFAAVKARGGVTWRVTRPGIENVNEHISETALDDHDFDQYIDNDGSPGDLANKIISLMDPITAVHNQGVRA